MKQIKTIIIRLAIAKAFAEAGANETTVTQVNTAQDILDKSSLKKRRFKASLSNDYLTYLLLNAKF